ncbi:MAG: hypothetical protein KAS59_03365, partial [Alphaproteobacteria bacterium]|nr:hypothetical protein [Alphaproteobacteria bacterium]
GSNNKTEQAFSFINEAGDDFHLSLTDTAAKDSGTDLSADANISFSNDIDSEVRSDAYDIGADEEMTVTWDGSESSNWATGANWAGGAAPTADSDVIIDGNYTNAPTLNLTSGITTINSLSLGVNNASVLTISNGNSTTNKLVVTEDVDVGATGTLTHTANATAQTHTINLEAANFTIADGGTINANSKGYGYSEGTGQGGGTEYTGGAGYGGYGGAGTGGAGGSTYGSITAPDDIGSGGGNWYTNGAAGGGAVKLTVTGITTIAGTISLNGGNAGARSGGGSGGSVYITTGTLLGAGTITANGGNGEASNCGGGGGGRIAVYYTTDSSTVSYQACGGLAGTSTLRMGGAGTIYKKSAAQTNGDLIIDNNDQDSLDDRYFGITPINETITFDTITVQNYGNLETTASSNVTYTTLDWATKGCISDNGGTFALLSGGGAMTVPAASRLYAYTTRTHTSYTVSGYMEARQSITTAGDFDIGAAGILTHEYNAAAQDYVLDITAANFTLADGGTINANSKGYQYSEGPGQAASSEYCAGAGYGGYGGDGKTTIGGSAYGSITAPDDIGSGGGNWYTHGAAGGGAVKLTVTGITTIAGTISLNGGNGGPRSGGGSGGSVYITTNTLAGAGIITVNGGTGNDSNCGGGGGGRIAMYYTTDSSTVSYQACGGLAGTSTLRMGGAGTIYKKSAAQTNGDLIIDNNDQDNSEDRYIGKTPINETIVFDTLTIQNYGHLETDSSSNITYTTLNWTTKGVVTDEG